MPRVVAGLTAVLLVAQAHAGPPPAEKDRSPVHFRPAKGNFADPIPFFWKGEYHVFYLRGDTPKVPWEHVVSKDLRTWRERPTALTSDGKAASADGLHMFTGCVVEHNGTFHLFYTGWNPANPKGREWIMHATSPDLTTWAKHKAEPFTADGTVYAKYLDADFRDPFVFRSPVADEWLMLLCCRAAKDERPVTGVYASKDLMTWEPRPPLCDGYKNTPECPDLFKVGDLWYLIVSPSENVVTYRTAKDLKGPWSPAPGTPLDTAVFYAAKRQWDGKRHVLTGWQRDLEDGKDGGRFRWGGTQSIPRELFAGPGGALLSRPVPEAREAYPKTVLDLEDKPPIVRVADDNKPAPDAGVWKYHGGSLVGEGQGLHRVRFDTPADYHLSLTVKLTGPAARFGVLFRQRPEHTSSHYRLEVRPGKSEATFAGPGWDFPRAVPFEPGKPVHVEAFVQGSVIECWVNGGHAFSCRAFEKRSGPLDLIVVDGKAEITELVVKAAEK